MGAEPFSASATAGRAPGYGTALTLTRMIVLAGYPLSAATLGAGIATGEPLVTTSGAVGLVAPIWGTVQLWLRRPHPAILIVLGTASVLGLSRSPAWLVGEASGLGLAVLGTAVILLHSPRRAPLYLAALAAAVGALVLLTHGVGPASGAAAVVLGAAIWGNATLHARVARRLRTSEARFRGAFENAPMAIVLTDGDLIRRVNPAFEALLGYSEDEAQGRPLASISPAGEGALPPRGSRGVPFERRYLHRDGSTIWGQTAVTTMRDPATGEPHHVVQILDATQPRAQLDAIRTAEEHQRSLLSALPVAVWEEDYSAVEEWLEALRRRGVADLRDHLARHPEAVAEGAGLIRVVDVNDAAVRLINAPEKGALLGRLLEETLTEETRESLIEQFAAIWEGRTSISVEVIGSTVDGRRIACELQWVAPVVAGRRDLTRVVVTITDLTERKQAQAELQRRVALENLITKLSTHFIDLGPEETDEGIDRALQAIGRHAGAGRSYLFLFSADGTQMTNTHEWCAPQVSPMKHRTQGMATAELPWICSTLRAGRVVAVPRVSDLPPEASAERAEFEAQGIASLICVPMARAGAVMGFVGFDSLAAGREWTEADARLLGLIGEMFANALERKAASERLMALMRSKDELIAAVSHELRTPLTAVLGLAEELQSAEGLTPQEHRQFLDLIVEQSRELAHLVEDLLVASRLETGQLKVAGERVSLSEQVAQTLRGLLPPPGRTVEVATGDADAWADALRVRQILRNLLTNAFRYGGNHISISVEHQGPTVALRVADDGAGVPAHEEGRIFEPYERAHHTPGRPGSLGLGLSVSRGLARLMGGDLRYRRGAPSAFVLSLPAGGPATASAGTARAAAGLPPDPFPPNALLPDQERIDAEA